MCLELAKGSTSSTGMPHICEASSSAMHHLALCLCVRAPQCMNRYEPVNGYCLLLLQPGTEQTPLPSAMYCEGFASVSMNHDSTGRWCVGNHAISMYILGVRRIVNKLAFRFWDRFQLIYKRAGQQNIGPTHLEPIFKRDSARARIMHTVKL